MIVNVVHTVVTQREVTVEIPDTVDERDVEQWLYENVKESDGWIVGGGWEITDYNIEQS